MRADGRTWRDERDERDGLRAGEPLADGRARRPRAGAALGAGVAAGDRPRPVRAPAGEARGDGRRDRGDPGAGRPRVRGGARAARRAGVRRLPARLRVHGGGRAGARAEAGGRRARVGCGDRTGRRAAARRGAPGDHGGDRSLLGSRRAGAAGARRDAADPGLPQRARAGLRAGGPRAVLLARALARPEGRGRGAGDRRADGLPPGVRRGVRRGDGDRRDRRGRARAPASARGRGGVLRRAAGDARGPARGGGRAGAGERGWIAELRAVETERREGERAEREDDRAPLHPMRLYAELGEGARPRRDRDRRRRRLRLLRGSRDRQLRAGLLAGPGPVRLPRDGPGVCARGEARTSRSPGRADARRRRVRLLGDGVRHARAPRRERGRR